MVEPQSTPWFEQKLVDLKALYDRGLLDKAVYEAKQQQVIDAMVDTAWINDNFGDAVEAAGPDGIVNPDHLAKNYVMLHQQPRDSWTFELDARPWVEKW